MAFANEGAEVAVLDTDLEAALATAKAIRGLGLRDVTDPRAVDEAMAQISLPDGGIDILVSNAGAPWSGPIGSISDSALRASFEVNFFGLTTPRGPPC